MDVHRLNINQYLLRIVAKGTISIQRYKDSTLTYHIFFYLNKPFLACQSYSDVSSNDQCTYHVYAPLLLLHSNSLVLDDLRFYYEEIHVIFIYEFNGYAIYEMEAM